MNIKKYIPRPVKDGVKQVLYPAIYPRHFHAYGVGTVKTGTTSMSGLFEGLYRANHEPDKNRLLEMILEVDEGKKSRDQLVDFVRKRDKRMWLEMDSSAFNAFIIDILVEEFPDAKFILTLRDCYSWLDSIINHQLSRSLSDLEIKFVTWWFKPENFSASEYEQSFADKNLFPIETYLHSWAAHNQKILDHVPKQNLMVMRTNEITNNLDQIEEFLSIPNNTLNRERSHLYQAKQKHGVAQQLDPDFLEALVTKHCKPLMDEYFPDIKGSAQVLGK